ncbi:glycerol-3-phosphate dehydrogenase [Nitratireductor kimnyeongensis]|uniref:Glycerol-3-phosphate dehydrogenase n=1 Tax=Nitratireductor kimnyeongensis TaxID=430679 RepID=A0ABW0TBI3_9HYPH|nr:glycerol-3-phosphate dehydrogenase [Nitratireductor kimnyeongensis]QZZ35547.1 glycerol-3-phosphate dehydrogenase [Nitratireductor kimnyeongensis]
MPGSKSVRSDIFDVFVIGGGINGCGIARDAVGRGYSVFLAEMNDLASGTSSGSTKLIHGGLRYLEYYEFRLVREALMEREILWRNAPHIIWPMRFVLPLHKGLRPAWLVRLGLFIYDHIGGRKLLPKTRTLDMRTDPAGKPLKASYRRAFEYSDCWVNDARFVVLNARDAADRGADVRIRTRVVSAEDENGIWNIRIQNLLTGEMETVRARYLVNAAGPWVDHVISGVLGQNDVHNVRLVKGSHIVVRQKFSDPRAYFFQNADGRIIFAIPYEEDFTLIGTTDEDYDGDPREVAISDRETDYLCAAASEYFAEPVTRDDIVWTYSGVRPLFDDGASKAQEATRDYVLKSETAREGAPMLHVFGGKITTYRKLAESALEKIGEAIGKKGEPWTETGVLPGGDFPANGYEQQVDALLRDYAFLERSCAARLIRLYGLGARDLLGGARSIDDLGRHFGLDLYEVELRYLAAREWAVSGEDVLWRRTKRGLWLTSQEAAEVDNYMRNISGMQDQAANAGGGHA